MNLRLIPVIELEPSSLGIDNFCELQERGLWSAHWQGVLAAAGLRPIRPGSWFVPASDFCNGRAIELLLRLHLTSDGTPTPSSIPVADEISAIAGGYAFSVDDAVQIEPGCCCDLSDLEGWDAAFRRGGGPAPVRIGHWDISLSADGSMTTVTLHSEVAGVPESHSRYPASAFAHALAQARVERRALAELVKDYLRQFAPGEQVDEVVSRLGLGL